MAVSRFEDLIAWQKARALARDVYAVSRAGAFSQDYGLKDQIRRASVSVMSNIGEGFERARPTEFHHFLCIAKSSCAELRSQLYVGLDVGHLTEDRFGKLLTQAEEVGNIIGGLRASINRRLRSQN